MSDIKLVVGVDVEKSYDPFRTGVDALVKSINAKPPKVKVEFDLGDLNQFRKSIEDISKAVRNQNNSFKSAGVNAGQSFASGFNSSTSSIDFTGGLSTESVKGMKKLLNSFKIDNSSVQKITADLENLNLEIKKITTTSNGKSVKLNIIGSDIDSSGAQRTLSIVKEFNLETQKMSTLSTNVSHVFGNLTAGSQAQINILTQLKNLLTRINQHKSSWSAAAHGSTADEYKKYDVLASSVEGYIETVKSANITQDDAKRALAGFKAELSSIDGVIKNAGKNTQSFTGKIGSLAQKFGSWLSVSQLIMRFYQGFKKVVTSVKELDTAMTELKKVTDATNSEYNKFLDEATLRAKKLGATLTDTVSASADMARLGYDLKEAASLADSALVYKNVGDGISNIDEASSSLISTMQAFEVEATDSMQIVDKFNTAGNKFAISSGGVGDALLNSASALAAAGNTLDESIALVTAANEVVQNPAKVGTTLKTVSMFLRAAKTDAEAAGENTEGMAESVSKLRTEILQLTGGKVDIQLDKDTFKSTTQILRELSQVWDSLSDISQANILERIGGKRNSNVVAALLGNFDTVDRVISETSRSSGSAMAENEKYLDSIAGKMSQFSATFEDFSNSLLSSDLFKFIVDVGTKLLEISDNIVDITGALPLIASGVSAFFTFKDNNSIFRYLNNDADKLIDKLAFLNIPLRDFKIRGSKGRKSVNLSSFSDIDKEAFSAFEIYREGGILDADSITKLKSAFTGLSKEASDLIDNAAKSGKSIEDMAVSMSVADKNAKKLKFSTAALNAATGMLASIAVSLIFQGLSKLYDSVAHAAENSREELENLKAEYDDNESKLKDLNSELETTRLRMYELLNMNSLSYTEQEELNKLKQSNTELGREISLLEQRNKLLKEQKELKFVETAEKSFDSYFSAREGLSGFDWFSNLGIGTTRKDIIRDKAEDYKHNQNMYEHFRGLYLTEENKSLQDKHKEAMDRAKKWLDDDLSYLSTQALEIESIISGIEYGSNDSVNLWLDTMNDMLDKIYISLGTEGAEDTAFSRLIDQTYDKVTDPLEELGKQGAVTASELNNEDYDVFIDKLIEIGYISDRTPTSLAKVARAFNALGEEATETSDSIDDAFKRWEDAQNEVQSGAQFDTLLDALEHVYDTVGDKTSDIFAKIGNSDFKAAVDLVIPVSADVDKSSISEVKTYLAGIKKYFTFDDNGEYSGLNVNRFLEESKKAGVMSYEKGKGYKVKDNMTIEKWAKEMNLSIPVIKAMIGELNEYGANIKILQLDDDLETLAKNTKTAVQSLEDQFDDLDIDIDLSTCESTEEMIEKLDKNITELGEKRLTLEADPTAYENCSKVMEYCIRQKQLLQQPAIMLIDTTQIDDPAVAGAINKIQKFINAKWELELNTKLGYNTEESQEELDKITKEIQDDLKSGDSALINIIPTLEPDSKTSIEEQIYNAVSGIDKTMLQEAFGLDASVFQPAIDALETIATTLNEIISGKRDIKFNIDFEGGQIKLSVDSGEVDEAEQKTESTKENLDAINDGADPKIKQNSIDRTIQKLIQIGNILLKFKTDPSEAIIDLKILLFGDSEATGSATTNTPSISINNDTKLPTLTTGSRLDKYLKPQIKIPDSGLSEGTAHANGDWRIPRTEEALVGELGTELLVRNGRWQTIGEHGAEFMNVKRGDIIFNHKQTESLLKNGRIFSRGKSFATGTAYGGDVISGYITPTPPKPTGTQGGNNSKKDDSSQTIDFVEIIIDRLTRAIDRLAGIVDDNTKSFKTREKSIDKEIERVGELIAVYDNAADTYKKKANSVSLSQSIKKKVRNGDYNINDYDSDTAELINEYRNYYEKYLDAEQNRAEQVRRQRELKSDKFDLTQQKYDSKFDLQDSKIDYYQSNDEYQEVLGNGGSIYSQDKIIDIQKRRISLIDDEIAELEKLKESAPKGSEEYYRYEKEIMDLKGQRIDAEKEIIELEERKSEIYINRAESIKEDYEPEQNYRDSRIDYFEAKNEEYETEHGYGDVNQKQKIYDELGLQIADKEAEVERLRELLYSGEIEEGSEEWYAIAEAINQSKEELVGFRTEQKNVNKEIDEINLDKFNKISEAYSYLDMEYEAEKSKYEDMNTTASLMGNSGSIEAQAKMYEIEASHASDLRSELDELIAERSQYSEGDANWEAMTSRIHEVEKEIRDSENAMLQYQNNAVDIMFSQYQAMDQLFNSQISAVEHRISLLDNDIAILEANGYKATSDFYQEQKKLQEDRLDTQRQQLVDMRKSFEDAVSTGLIKEHSQEWYDWMDMIYGVEEGIGQTELAIASLDKSIRNLEWENFDYVRESISDLTKEADNYIDLMSYSDIYDDKGNITDEGMATLGLTAQKYNIYMSESIKYAEELADIEKKLADDPNNLELINRKRELEDAQWACVSAAQKEKKAMRDLVEDGIKYELDALKELIDEYKEALDKAKDLHDYEKKVSEQSSEISSLRKQLSAYSGDDSLEAKMKIQKLQEDLKKAEDELKETEYDRYISDQKELLDEFYLEYETNLNARLDDIDTILENMTDIVNANTSDIYKTISEISKKFGVTLSEDMESIWNSDSADKVFSTYFGENGYIVSEQTAISSTLSEISNKITKILEANKPVEREEWKPSIDNSNNESSSNNQPYDEPSSGNQSHDKPSGTTQELINSTIGGVIGGFVGILSGGSTTENNTQNESQSFAVGDKVDAYGAKVYHLFGDANSLGKIGDNAVYTIEAKGVDTDGTIWSQINNGGKPGQGLWVKDSDLKLKKYKNGGLIDYTGMAWVDGSKNKPEYMLNASETEAFVRLSENIHKFYKNGGLNINSMEKISSAGSLEDMAKSLSQINNILSSKETNIGDINITIPIDRVQDYNDFVTQLRDDPKFEKFVQTVSIDLLGGNSRLAKNKINWK